MHTDSTMLRDRAFLNLVKAVDEMRSDTPTRYAAKTKKYTSRSATAINFVRIGRNE